jgi:hypothetical protein
MEQKKLTVSFLNVKSLKHNFNYPLELVKNSNIVYLNELWLKQTEINIVNDLCPNYHTKKIFFKSDMPEKSVSGRPFGGQCWILDNSIEIVNYEFLSRHVSYIHIKKITLNSFL